jgi:DNA-binding helix-hairpin-helix protein with protein kinase domain
MPAQTRVKPALFDLAGHPLHLGSQLGSGGEGAVYELRDRSDVVAKLYHKPLGPEKSAKIAAMAKFGNERLRKLTAWPTEPIRVGAGTGPVVGFTMPKITAHKQAFIVYSPKLRLQEFSIVSWRFLIRSAANAARAFAVVHENGHVVGDVNDGNLFVGEKATVRLIDCDSYQIALNGSRWLCDVGTPPYQPPELQNRAYRQLARTPNHDNFGLAVIIFRLLFMARHPFAGNFLGSGQMPMERAISEYRFVYGSNAAAMQMRPPPASLGLNGVTRDTALLFERAFSKQGSEPNGRPRPDEWVRALQDLEQHLKKCSVNPAHQFVDTLSKCPWCEIESASGVPLFPVAVVGSTVTGFTIAAFWARVNSVPNPGPPPPLPRVGGLAVTLSPDLVGLQKAAFDAKLAADLPAVIGAITRLQYLKNEIETREADARRRWQTLQSNWNRYTSSKEFQDLLSALQSLRSQYDALPQKRLQGLQNLESNRYRLQLNAHLDRCRISHARIKGVGVAKKAMLQSYGIETAADIVDHRVLAVPGFGPVLLSNLQRWRDQQERRFVFDRNKGVDQSAKNAVERLILTEKMELEHKLNEGLSKLIVSSNHIRTRRRTLQAQAEQAAHDLVQAEADLRTAEQASRDLAQAEADLRAADQAARQRPQAEINLHAAERPVGDQARAEAGSEPPAAPPPTPRLIPSTNLNTKAFGRAIFALGAFSIAGLVIASQLGKGPSGVTSQPMPLQVQSQPIPPRAAAPLLPVQPILPPHVEKDLSGQLRPEDGYDWSDARHASVRWQPGKISREHPHIIAADTEGDWQPDDGYDWTDPNRPKNKLVRWVPGIVSNRYPNVVAATIEGQWRPANGYTWVLNAPGWGDMRVKPVPPPEDQSSVPLRDDAFQRGLADRTDWEQWIATLIGDFRRGAEWWASRRSLPNRGSCNGPVGTGQEFVIGCEAAKARLTPADMKRKTDPEYRRGWNNYAGMVKPPSSPDVQGSPVEQTVNLPQASESDAADRLNARERKRLQGQ